MKLDVSHISAGVRRHHHPVQYIQKLPTNFKCWAKIPCKCFWHCS